MEKEHPGYPAILCHWETGVFIKVGRLVESHVLFVPHLCQAGLDTARSFCSKTVLKVSVPSETTQSLH